MTDLLETAFRSYLRDDATELLEALAQATGGTFEIRGASDVVFARHGELDPASSADHRLCSAPLVIQGDTYATLHANVPARALPLVDAVANDLAARFVAEFDLENMTDRLSQCYDELNLLFRLSTMQKQDERFETSCRASLRETADFMEGRSLVLYLSDQKLRAVSTGGQTETRGVIRTLAQDNRQLQKIFQAMAEVRLHTTDDGPDRHVGAIKVERQLLRYISIPVWSRDEVVGFVAIVQASGEAEPSTDELRLIECLAAQLSGGQTTRRLYNEIKDALFNTIMCLVATIEAKDAYTRGHSERVYRLSVKLGERLGLEGEALQNLAWSALLHDIGKIAIPVHILAKPTRLTDEEYDLIKTHPERGCQVLEPIPQFRPILPGIRSHHERVDGRGYPDGLSGERIPFMARIIGVADTFDAMVSTRAYRAARTMDSAIEEMKRCAGTQLDPVIVDAFLALVAEGEVQLPGPPPVEEEAA